MLLWDSVGKNQFLPASQQQQQHKHHQTVLLVKQTATVMVEKVMDLKIRA
jgi:hypothetical protein